MPLKGCRWRTDCRGKFPFLNGNPSARTHSCTNPGRSAAKHFRFPFRLASFRPVRCGAYLSEFAAVALPALASSPYCPCNVFRVARSYFHTASGGSCGPIFAGAVMALRVCLFQWAWREQPNGTMVSLTRASSVNMLP